MPSLEFGVATDPIGYFKIKYRLKVEDMMKLILMLSAFFMMGLLPMVAEEASILELKGTGKVLNLKTFGVKKLKKGMALENGDIVKTGPKALVHLEMASGRIALVKANSTFKVLSDSKKKHQMLDFTEGEFLIGTLGKIKDDETFSIRTPATVAGVRGTLFWGLADSDLNATFACFESTIVLSSNGAELVLNANEKAFVVYGEKPSKKEAANIPLSYLDTFKVDGYLQALDDLLK